MVEFAEYAPQPEGYLGHPQGLEWFCDDHLIAARAVSGKSSEEAIELIKLQYGVVKNTPPIQSTKPTNQSLVSRVFRFLKIG